MNEREKLSVTEILCAIIEGIYVGIYVLVVAAALGLIATISISALTQEKGSKDEAIERKVEEADYHDSSGRGYRSRVGSRLDVLTPLDVEGRKK